MSSLVLTLVLSAWSTPPPPPEPAAPPVASAVVAPSPAEENRWPGAHTFGLRAGLGGGTATAGVEAGNVGVTYLLSDSLALNADLGLGLSASNGGGTATMAIDGLLAIYLGEPVRSLRVYVPLLFGVGIDSRPAVSSYATATTPAAEGVFQLALGAGVGAEYWFSKHFSFGAELMLRLLLANLDPLLVHLGTLTPGLRATYYF